MAISNRERIGKALDLLGAGLVPFVERELKAVHGAKWEDVAREGQPAERGRGKGKPAKAGTPTMHWDTQALLAVMWNQWNTVFSRTLGPAERSIVSELRDARNFCPKRGIDWRDCAESAMQVSVVDANLPYIDYAKGRRTAKSNAKGSGPCFRRAFFDEFHPPSPKNGPDPGLCSSPAGQRAKT